MNLYAKNICRIISSLKSLVSFFNKIYFEISFNEKGFLIDKFYVNSVNCTYWL